MANVLNEEKKQQVLALGRLGWPLRQIQKATHIRRETASQYLKAAGIAVRPPRGWGRRAPKPANEVITDFGAGKPTIAEIADANGKSKTDPENPATKGKANSKTGQRSDYRLRGDPRPPASPASQSGRFLGFAHSHQRLHDLPRGHRARTQPRNAMAIWQDLVSEYGH